MLTSPFPKEIAFSVVSAGDMDGFTLSPEEEALLRGAKSELYRRNFRLGRAAAREALYSLGFSEIVPVVRNQTGAPEWPKGFIGSISHKDGIGVAAVGKTDGIKMLGIDLECITGSNSRIKDRIKDRVAHERELPFLESQGDIGVIMLFSAKEALYKALSPVHRRFIGFKDVWLDWSEKDNLFTAHPASKEVEYLFSSPVKIGIERLEDLILASVVVYH